PRRRLVVAGLDGDREARPGRAARGRDRQRRGDVAAAQDRRRGERGGGHRAAPAERRQAGRDGTRHRLHQDDPGPARMTVTCPEGHPSESTDYCDVCGTPIPAAGSAAPAAPDPAADPAASTEGGETESGPVTCPNCGELSPGGSLFCENCGYDFTTGTP